MSRRTILTGAVTTYSYYDTASPPSREAITNGHAVTTIMDGFGRTIQTNTGYGSTLVSTQITKYAPCGCSPLGKMSQQSQPYGPGGTPVYTKYTYDASGRTLTAVLPDGSTTTYQYTGNWLSVTDPAGNWKAYGMDPFGNLVAVQETDPGLGNVETTYTYDVLNHLTGVSMPRGSNTQTRTFNYNIGHTVTGFLQSATNPENGTITYTYNSGTNTLASKTDAKNNTLTYQYDIINRLISVTWSNAPGGSQTLRSYFYDTNYCYVQTNCPAFQNQIGRLSAVVYAPQVNTMPFGDPVNIQLVDMFSYSEAGLPTSKSLQVYENLTYDSGGTWLPGLGAASIDVAYTYNNEGKMLSISYPYTVSNGNYTQGAYYQYSYDSMYRLNGMTDINNNSVVSNVSYNAANQLLTMNFSGTSESRTYNSLNQLTNIADGSSLNLTYNYPAGTNNGKVSSIFNAISGETVTYTYDSLNRLLTANGSGWGQQYGFDPFGNLLAKTVTSGSGPSLSISVNQANNQIQGVSGLSYDANGNQITSGISYDVENHLIGQNYLDDVYDGQNELIFSWQYGSLDNYDNPTNFTVVLYSPFGQRLATYQLAPWYNVSNGNQPGPLQVTLLSSDQYFGGRRLAVMDQLGSVGTYYPWGENRGTTDPQNTWGFGTYWVDPDTGLDYAMNRYYSNAYGRFMTPDPYQASASASNPQSWNRYAYVNGDPANGSDPTGLYLPLPAASSGDAEGWDYGGSGASGGGLGDDGDSSSDPSWDLLWSVWVQVGGTGSGAGGGGGASGAGVAADNFAETQDATDAYNDLAKGNCYKLLGFATAAAAQSWFKNHITFSDVQLGNLQVKNGAPAPGTPPPSETSGYGAIYLNTDYNWADFSKVTTSTGSTYNYLAYLNKVYSSNMTSEQLGTFLIVHELLHNRPSDVGETVKAGQTIINDCLK
jgi:RHS repeat-associated protein